MPFGVNYLWDPVATVALAVATDAAVFAREIFTGVYDSDMGLWQPDAAPSALRMRHDLGRDDLKLLFNINAEFAAPVGDRSDRGTRQERRLLVACRCRVGVRPHDRASRLTRSNLQRVEGRGRRARRCFANTGCNIDNIADILSRRPMAASIGTHFKVDGDTWNAVDPEPCRTIHGGRGEGSQPDEHCCSAWTSGRRRPSAFVIDTDGGMSLRRHRGRAQLDLASHANWAEEDTERSGGRMSATIVPELLRSAGAQGRRDRRRGRHRDGAHRHPAG